VLALGQEMAWEWFLFNGGESMELSLESATMDLKLHLLEACERAKTHPLSDDLPKRWQVAPGVAATCRSQIMKLTTRLSEMKQRVSEIIKEVVENYGFRLDGGRIEPEVLTPAEATSDGSADMPEAHTAKPISIETTSGQLERSPDESPPVREEVLSRSA
jgi:hypothetical protein